MEATKEEHKSEKEQERVKEVETVDSPACTPREANLSSDEGANVGIFNFSIDEFPVLPGSKPIPIKVSQPDSLDPDEVKETSASLDSLECASSKNSSPRSLSQSEAGKQSDCDVLDILGLVIDPTTETVVEDQNSSKSEEQLYEFLMPFRSSCFCI